MLVWNHSAASSYIQQDTLRRDTIRITPYFAETPVKALGNFAVVDKDRYAFQNYAAFNVLNTLRGHVPNLNISPNADGTSAGLRSNASMLVIDGLPYAGAFSSYYNLNSFEYANIYAVSSGNAAFPYGGLASDGVIFLQSKTGKNIFRPSVEFNSSALLTPKEVIGSSTAPESWQFTSAIAYAQDYGAADLRVSYNGSYFPPAGTWPETERGINNVRINTGVDIADRLHARLILDGVRNNATAKSQSTLTGSSVKSEALMTNLQGNLMLQYQATDWLSITSQGALAGIDSETGRVSSTLTSNVVQENKRSFVNLMAAAHQSLGEKFLMREFAGVQYERQKIFNSRDQFSGSSASGEWGKSEYNSKSLLAGLGLQYDKFLFADVNYRSERFSTLPEKTDIKPSFAVTSAFVFSEAFHWQNGWLSSGKLRGSYGKANVSDIQEYPRSLTLSGEGILPNPSSFAPMEKRMMEAGADLSFLGHRLRFNISHFHDVNDQTLATTSIPGGSGFVSTTVDLGAMHIKGWETVLAGSAIRRNNLSLYTKLIWSTYKNYIESATRVGTQPTSLGSPFPDWTGGVLNQLSIRNFFSTFLVDARKGGDFYSGGFGSQPRIYDGTNVKLRDLTIGYQWPDNLAVRTQISLSARNLWTIYAKDENVEQAFDGSIPRKSFCVSVTVSF